MKIKTTYEHEGKEYLIVVNYDRCLKVVEDVVKVYELIEKNGKYNTCPCSLDEKEIEEIVNDIEWLCVYRDAFNKDYEEEAA